MPSSKNTVVYRSQHKGSFNTKPKEKLHFWPDKETFKEARKGPIYNSPYANTPPKSKTKPKYETRSRPKTPLKSRAKSKAK